MTRRTGRTIKRRDPKIGFALEARERLLARLRGGASPAPAASDGEACYALRVEPAGAGACAVTLRGPDGLRVDAQVAIGPGALAALAGGGDGLGPLLLPPPILAALPTTSSFQLRVELTTPTLAALPRRGPRRLPY